MADMPKRVRSHRLESESRRRFRDLIEDHGWVVREMDRPDYGLDDMVEVFDGDDGTGVTFLVQSRGTDDETADAMRVPIRREQQNYFAAFNDPVLVVRYHAATGCTLAKWFHQADPYPRAERSSITLTYEDELTPESVEALATETRRFRAFRSAGLEWPVALTVRSDELDPRGLELAIGTVLQEHPDLIRFVGSDDLTIPYVTVTVSDERLIVDAGLASHTVHGPILGYSVADIAAGVVLAAGEVLDTLGHGGRASDLFEASLLAKGLPADVLDDVGQRLGRAGRMDVALRVAEAWGQRDDLAHQSAAVLLLGAAASRASRRDTGAIAAAASFADRLAEGMYDADAQEAASAAFLTAARARFAIGDWPGADQDFRRALECGLETTREELLAEVAGAAHQAGDYERAIEMYTDLVDNAGRSDLAARLADSLTRFGRFTAALERFGVYLAEPRAVPTIWLLTREALIFLRESGFDDTERDPDLAARRLDARLADETSEQTVDRCLFAARADPLFEPAWRELGAHQLERERLGLAYGPLILAAIVKRSPEAWARVFITAHRGDNRVLAEAAVHMGAGDYGDEFHVAIRNEAGVSAEDTAAIAAAADEIDRASGRWRRGDAPPGGEM
jgi:tetratricopeptide (TPR) repeat protein